MTMENPFPGFYCMITVPWACFTRYQHTEERATPKPWWAAWPGNSMPRAFQFTALWRRRTQCPTSSSRTWALLKIRHTGLPGGNATSEDTTFSFVFKHCSTWITSNISCQDYVGFLKRPSMGSHFTSLNQGQIVKAAVNFQPALESTTLYIVLFDCGIC